MGKKIYLTPTLYLEDKEGDSSILYTEAGIRALNGFHFTSPGCFIGNPAFDLAYYAITGGAHIFKINNVDHLTISETAITAAVPFASLTSNGRIQGRQSDSTVASATTITLGADGNAFEITGTTTINKIAVTGWQAGSIITLRFGGALTLTNGAAVEDGALYMAGGSNRSATAGAICMLQLLDIGGTLYWRELSYLA